MPETMIERVAGVIRHMDENRWRWQVRDDHIIKVVSDLGTKEAIEELGVRVPEWVDHDDALTEIWSMNLAREIVTAMKGPTEQMIAICDRDPPRWDGYTNSQRYDRLIDAALAEE